MSGGWVRPIDKFADWELPTKVVAQLARFADDGCEVMEFENPFIVIC